jgi:hypothetical protein
MFILYLRVVLKTILCHSCISRNLFLLKGLWIPASAGMTVIRTTLNMRKVLLIMIALIIAGSNLLWSQQISRPTLLSPQNGQTIGYKKSNICLE